MLRRIGPKSLAGQLMLVLALALLLAQAINLALLVRAARQERLTSVAAAAAAQIADASDRIASGLPLGVIDLRARLGRQDGTERRALRAARDRDRDRDGDGDGPRRGRRIILSDAPRFRPGMTEWPDLASRVDEFLKDANVEVRAVRAGQMAGVRRYDPVGKRDRATAVVAVAAQLPDGRWVTARARTPVNPPRLGSLLVIQTAILFVLLIGPLLWVAWRVSRPLKTLAQAAGDMRPGADETPVAESGPEDVRALTRAFNAMQGRIRFMLAEKDHMLGAVGHDLRTPLASLRVRVEQIGDERLRDKMAATIAEMTTMLDDILSLARAGQPKEPPEPTDLAALLAELVGDYRAMGKPVELAAEGAVVTRTVRAASLRRALRNLIDNAVTYGGSATVGLTEQAGVALLSVEDHGPGIPPDRIAEMMEPFARAESSRNRNTGGSGLGLALAKALVLAEGGRLELANRTGGGLAARVLLPGD